MNNLPTSTYKKTPILRKGDGYFLTGFYKTTSDSNTYYNMYGGFYYTSSQDLTAEIKYQNTDADSPIEEGWNHIALSYDIENGTSLLRLYINGKLTGTKTDSSERTPRTVSKALVIGYYYDDGFISGTDLYFKGLIDSIKISNTAKYTADFTPAKLSLGGEDTIAFWDFSGNAEDSSANGLNGTATGLTYSTDCK